IAITLAPEQVVQEIRKELKDAQRERRHVDEVKVRKSAYSRAKSAASANQDVTWDAEAQERIRAGKPAPLESKTKITAEQILAIGLPDLAVEKLPGAALQEEPAAMQQNAPAPAPAPAPEPASMHLNIVTVIDHLLLPDREKV